MDELKPCPFCGGTEIFVEPDETGSGGQWVTPIHVGCKKCQCEQMADDMDEAITAWNTRPREDAGALDAQDAARYRWLRDAPATSVSEPIRNWLWTRPFGADMACLDAAIDAALAAALGKSNG